MLPAVGIGFGLFLGGVVLGYYLVLPTTLRFFFSGRPIIGLDSHLDGARLFFVCYPSYAWVLAPPSNFRSSFASGSVLGVSSVALLRKTRAYAFLLIFVAAAFLAPTPDALSMAMMGGPMYLLYEICILIAWLMERKGGRKMPMPGAGK